MLAWFRRGGVAEQIKSGVGTAVSVIKMKGSGQGIPAFRSNTQWTNEESVCSATILTSCECEGTGGRLGRNELALRKAHTGGKMHFILEEEREERGSVLSSKCSADYVEKWCF